MCMWSGANRPNSHPTMCAYAALNTVLGKGVGGGGERQMHREMPCSGIPSGISRVTWDNTQENRVGGTAVLPLRNSRGGTATLRALRNQTRWLL